MDESSLELAEGTLRRRNLVHAFSALLLMIVVPPLVGALALLGGIFPLAALAPLSLFGGVLLWTANLAPRERLGRIAAGELGLFFEGHLLATRRAILSGRVLGSGGDTPVVRLVTRRGPIELRVKRAIDGGELLRALGVDRSPPRAVRLGSRILGQPASLAQVTLVAMLLPVLFGALGLSSRAHPMLFAALSVATATATLAVLVSLLAPTTLTEREGGVEIAWLGRRRFLRHEEIEDVRLVDVARGIFGPRARRGVSLFLRSGEAIALELGEEEASPADVIERVFRLREALAPPRAAADYRSPPAALPAGDPLPEAGSADAA